MLVQFFSVLTLLTVVVDGNPRADVIAAQAQLSRPTGGIQLSCKSCFQQDCDFTKLACRRSSYGEYFPSMNLFPLSAERLSHAGFFWCPSSTHSGESGWSWSFS
eukprot:760055-Hanusia_phi.AAC.2